MSNSHHPNSGHSYSGTRDAQAGAAQSNMPIGTASPMRFGAVMPLAAGATLLLLVSMAQLITTEFQPQDKAASSAFEINPVPDDIPPNIEIQAPDPLKQVEVPPPPPILDIVKVTEVKLPVIIVDGGVEPFDPHSINIPFGERGIVPIDGDPTPIVRIPPVFPARFSQGDYSGYCRVSFDVSAEGQPFNVSVLDCTNTQLKAASVKSVQKWKYRPEILDGRSVSRAGLQTTIQFQLTDERGRLLPLPSGT